MSIFSVVPGSGTLSTQPLLTLGPTWAAAGEKDSAGAMAATRAATVVDRPLASSWSAALSASASRVPRLGPPRVFGLVLLGVFAALLLLPDGGPDIGSLPLGTVLLLFVLVPVLEHEGRASNEQPQIEVAPMETEALLELAPNVLLTAPARGGAHLAALGRLVHGCTCHRLATGRDLEALPALLLDLLRPPGPGGSP